MKISLLAVVSGLDLDKADTKLAIRRRWDHVLGRTSRTR